MIVPAQLLDQQKEFYKEMLLQQQDNFKCFIQLIMDATNKRLDGVIRGVQDRKTGLEFTQEKFEEKRGGYIEFETNRECIHWRQERVTTTVSQSTIWRSLPGKQVYLKGS